MTNPTSNFGWQMPTATDLVTDLPADFEVFGQAVDTDFVDLLGGTTGQILSKASATDLDFTWITNDVGDITAVTAGIGISGGGTSGAVTVTNSMATAIDAKGDLIAGTGADTFARLPIGTNGQILSADSAAATGLTWITNDIGDITAVNVTAPVTGGGASGAVTIGVSAASTSASGVVQLSDSISTTSSVLAGTSTAVKTAYDKGATASAENALNNLYAGKNKLINGDMSIWQRGTSFTATGYTADRYYCTVSGTTTFAQETTVIPSNSRYALKWTTGAASSYGQVRQFIERGTVIPLQGKTMTVSAMVRLGTGFSGTLQFESYYSTTTDTNSGFSGTAIVFSSTTGTPVVGSYVQISATFVVPATAIGLYVGIVPTSVQASGIIAYMGNIQLEVGSTATAFQTASDINNGTELTLCQRYYQRITADDTFDIISHLGTAATTTKVIVPFAMGNNFRVTPTTVDYSVSLSISPDDVATTIAVSSATMIKPTATCVNISLVVTGATAFRPYYLYADAIGGYIGVGAEL